MLAGTLGAIIVFRVRDHGGFQNLRGRYILEKLSAFYRHVL
jgi:hypothetical protein